MKHLYPMAFMFLSLCTWLFDVPGVSMDAQYVASVVFLCFGFLLVYLNERIG